MSERRVVITGIGVVTPLGCDLEVFWKNLLTGQSGIGPVTRFDTTKFDSKIGGEVKDFKADQFMPIKETRRTDRFTHYAVGAARKAVADSKIELDKEDLNRVGCLVGSGIGGMETIEEQAGILLTKGPGRVSPFMIPMLIVNMASGYISMLLGVKGPNLSVVSACATATHAIGEAARAIVHNDADVMISGGSEAAITGLGYAGFCSMRAMSTRNDDPTRASRPFDAGRDGFVMGEGAGVVILESLEHARKRHAHIYAEVAGYGITGDAYHMSAPAPEGEGAARSMAMALRHARLNPDQIEYINAHGTSTPVGDKCETQAIKSVFGAHAKKLAVSSTKSMTGHLLGAAGAVETAVCALAIRDNIVPPTINYETPDPDCDLDYVPNKARQMKVNACVNNSLGFGGHNATLIVKRYE
ncbi:MAG: 3-oxoacyl-[acyl-carrier-protein] synthase 2 [Verrucomicrobiae bacterium]|nr:3-oxoacyl-[acyl-carrier-protein] synthase 2 [Verrucomicrobiae bacterium]